ncbi:N-acetylmuramidase domain-containing protein [Cupriavidus basilensis]|uniref:Putative phage-encoded peptidoglycan binding protein n=1 Tax=Cupriavidus basilensis TaxID=68895 RepID=A0A0C4Y838_9BURK|nr:N-acetylmuramidase domain-containing protein [Cupriavidus basilensis]AJG19128.1 Putative phage-encoded peptidoglycan binding protein [Cupriavidus basilensis]
MTILRRGSSGDDVLELQRLLRLRGATLPLTSHFGIQTDAAVRAAQARYGLVIDGIAGPKTFVALQIDGRQPGHLAAADLQRAADKLALPLAVVRAVNEVESRGTGFLPDGRPAILFERHIMYRQLRLAKLDADDLAKGFPKLVNPARGGYMGGASEHVRLAGAMHIHRDSALESASWGLFQIMGFHWLRLGYASVLAYTDAMRTGEPAQLGAFVRFVETDPALHKALKTRKWDTFASIYNGAAYKANLYDIKLARAYERYQAEEQATV